MHAQPCLSDQQCLALLRREWAVYLAASLLFLVCGAVLIHRDTNLGFALVWLLAAAAVTLWVFVSVWRELPDNRLKDSPDAPLLPTLGIANGLTITRAVFNAALVGFLFGPRPDGWLAWVPGCLYLVSCSMDFLDGYAARRTGMTTILGETLDMRWDSVGILIGAGLAVRYAQAPPLYLFIGAARYLYLGGIWLHTRSAHPVGELPWNPFRRPLAGLQMGLVGVILLPIFPPAVTNMVAGIWMLPSLVGFARDFLYVTGHLQPRSTLPSPNRARVGRLWVVGPLVLRGVLVVALLFALDLEIRHSGWLTWVLAVLFLLSLATFLGVAGRLAALGAILLAGFGLRAAPFEWVYWMVLGGGVLLFLTGTGEHSLWKPEEWLIYHRAGENIPKSPPTVHG